MAKTPAKKKASKKVAIATTSKTIAIRPTANQLAAAEKCLERSGKIVIGFKDISVTKLPRSIAPVLTFKD